VRTKTRYRLRIENFERELIASALEERGSVRGAAAALGIGRPALHKRMHALGIDSPFERAGYVLTDAGRAALAGGAP
jgi:DNA-binding NtrC family response regulator